MSDTSQKKSVLKKLNDLYKPLESGFYLPTVDPYAGSPTKVVVRNIIVDMEELNDNLHQHAPDWNILEVYADVLVFPLHSEKYGEFAFKLGGVSNQRATIFARSIVVADGNGVFINYNPETQISIYASEIVEGSLFFAGLQGDPGKTTPIELQEGAVGLSIHGTNADPTPLFDLPEKLVEHNSPAYWLLESSFNVGSALVYDRPELAGNILSWVSLTASFGTDIDATHLALNAANLQGFVSQLQSKIPFVPPLSAQMYKEVTEGYLSSAVTFEEGFNDTMAQSSQHEDFGAYVAANKDYFIDQTDVEKQLVDQMRKNVAESEKVLTQNSDKLKDLVKHDGTLEAARQAFKNGIEKYEAAKKREAILGVCTAMFEIGGSLAAMSAGDEAAAGTVVQGAEAVAETGSKLKDLVEAVKKLAKVIKKLADLVKKLRAAQEAIEKLTTANNLESSTFTKGIEVKPDDNEIFDNAYWEKFTTNVTHILTPYTTGDTNIEGASDYLEQLQYLAVYGKAVYANSLALIDLRQKLFKLVLEEQIANNQQKRLEHLVADQKAEAEHLQKAKVIYYQKLLRVKSRLIFYMDEQIAAYRYWAVMPDLPKEYLPSLRDTVGELQKKLADIVKLRADALETWDPSPSPMNLTFEITDPALIAQLRKTRELSYTIAPDRSEFKLEEHVEKGHPAKEWGRVRVNDVRAYLNDDAILDRDKTIKIEVSTSSHYYDRYRGTGLLEYVSSPKEINFEYTLSEKDDPVAPGKVVDEFRYDYFEPTAFTTWKIKIMNDINSLNKVKLDAVTLHLRGSWAAYEVAVTD